MSSTIESVLQETRVFPPSAEFVKQANISGMEAYRKLCDEAERDFEGFWGRLAKEHVLWRKPFTKVLDESKAPFYRWFYDGELNASYNCLDLQVERGLGLLEAGAQAALVGEQRRQPARAAELSRLDTHGKRHG